MKLLTTIFLLCSFSVSFAQNSNQFDAHGKRHGKWMKKYEGTNQVRYQGTFDHGQEIGTFTFYKQNKNPNAQSYLFASKTYTPENDTVKIKYYTKKGSVMSTGSMLGKKRVGKWKYYHSKNHKVMQEEVYVNGELNGLLIVYFKNGNIAKKSIYKDGKQNGITKIFDKNGKLQKLFTYKNGELHGMVKYFDDKGQLTAKGLYEHNRKDGIWKNYKNGEVVKTTKYPIQHRNEKSHSTRVTTKNNK